MIRLLDAWFCWQEGRGLRRFVTRPENVRPHWSQLAGPGPAPIPRWRATASLVRLPHSAVRESEALDGLSFAQALQAQVATYSQSRNFASSQRAYGHLFCVPENPRVWKVW